MGVISFPKGSSLAGTGWWIIGGMLGLVGLGRVRLSLNIARLPRSRGGLKGSGSVFSFVAKIDDCDTPVDGALAIRFAAFGVAVCKIGLLMVGRAGTVGGGLFDVLSGSLLLIKESLSADGELLVTDVGDDIAGSVVLKDFTSFSVSITGVDAIAVDDLVKGWLTDDVNDVG